MLQSVFNSTLQSEFKGPTLVVKIRHFRPHSAQSKLKRAQLNVANCIQLNVGKCILTFRGPNLVVKIRHFRPLSTPTPCSLDTVRACVLS